MSFEVIIPFLKPIEHLLVSKTVSEIMSIPMAPYGWRRGDGCGNCRKFDLTMAHCKPALK